MVDGEDKAAGKTPVTPAPAPGGAPLHLTGFFTDFPCLPFLPQILLDLCHAIFGPPSPSPPSPPKPTECRSSLAKVMPSCAGFLTNSSVSVPPSTCCEGIHSFYRDESTSPFCLCHVANGEVDQLLPAPLNQTRAVTVLVACKIGLREDEIIEICDKDSKSYSKFLSHDN
uniref:Bifunctional inhibitor/plant lipid transfer protein/seed storage helical domain-containing protein n=1 Tax=Arundo donax TaxID=35708 RepID=A0A0A9AQS6_ARUDO